MVTVRETLAGVYGDGWQQSIDHIGSVIDTYRTDGPVFVFDTRLVSDRNIHGYDEPVAVSNYRTLYSDWQWSDALFTGTWSNVDSIGLRLDEQCPDGLTDVIDSLADYPVLDEQLWSEVEWEMMREHWDSYGLYDARATLADALGIESTDYLDDSVDELLTSLTFDYADSVIGDYPTFIDVSACEFYSAEVIRWIVARDRVVSLPRYGARFDLRRSALVSV